MNLNKTQRIIALFTAAIIVVFEIVAIIDHGIEGFMWVVPLVAIGLLLIIAFSGDGFSNCISHKLKRIVKFISIGIAVIGVLLILILSGVFKKKEEAPTPADPYNQLTDLAPEIHKWDERKNWRQLQKGMSMKQVKELLGEPSKVVSGGLLVFWTYGSGNVSFDSDSGRVDGWTEPDLLYK